jgi:hypothetical protein
MVVTLPSCLGDDNWETPRCHCHHQQLYAPYLQFEDDDENVVMKMTVMLMVMPWMMEKVGRLSSSYLDT